LQKFKKEPEILASSHCIKYLLEKFSTWSKFKVVTLLVEFFKTTYKLVPLQKSN
jgi:hypothetical protein